MNKETKQQIDKFFKEVDTSEFPKSPEECFDKIEENYKMKTIKKHEL